jgi:pyruvate formate lyase activating enzyme
MGSIQARPKAAPDHDVSGMIWDIKQYALHDGPGIRTTVFFKGCPLKCLWCCNPESQSFQGELLRIAENCIGCGLCRQSCPHQAIAVDPWGMLRADPTRCRLEGICVKNCPGEAWHLMGRQMTVAQVLTQVAKDAVFYHRSGGGLTLSGGEPLAQPHFAEALLRHYKQSEGGRHAAIETCGHARWTDFARLLPYVDLFLFDLKHMDPKAHRRLTGRDNRLILQNARRLAHASAKIIFRMVIVPGCNDSRDNLQKTAAFIAGLPAVKEVDLLPYHRLGEPKYARLLRDYALAGLRPAMDGEVAQAKTIFEDFGLQVGIGG